MKTRSSDSRVESRIALAAVALLTHSSVALVADIIGLATVINGDTIEIRGRVSDFTE